MLLQEFVRGMRNVSPQDVDFIFATGLQCQALRADPRTPLWELEQLLTDDNLDRHRHEHDIFGPASPYISTTAGTYRERAHALPDGRLAFFNQGLFARDTALAFAVLAEQTDGWLFYGYHFLLGRPAGRHAEFAEEIRDVHQHPQWSRYRGEGEVAAAVRIPSRRLQRAERYRYDDVVAAIEQMQPVVAREEDIVENPRFEPPEDLLAARAVI